MGLSAIRHGVVAVRQPPKMGTAPVDVEERVGVLLAMLLGHETQAQGTDTVVRGPPAGPAHVIGHRLVVQQAELFLEQWADRRKRGTRLEGANRSRLIDTLNNQRS